MEILAEYDFEVEHRPGHRLKNADALSTKQAGMTVEGESPLSCTCSIEVQSYIPKLSSTELQNLQKSDPDIDTVIKWLQNSAPPQIFIQEATHYRVSRHNENSCKYIQGGNPIYRVWEDIEGGGRSKRLQLVIPKRQVKNVLLEIHNVPTGGHLGMTKVLEMEKVRERFCWMGQRRDVEN